LLDARVRLRIADDFEVHLVQAPQAVERAAAHVAGDARRVVDIEDRIARGAEAAARVLARQVAGLPEASGDRLHLLGVGRPGDEDDERRQVLIERAEAVGRPCAEAGPAGHLVAGLHVGDGGFVVDRLGVHGADEAHVIDHTGRVR
jgi:hypothetical protein